MEAKLLVPNKKRISDKVLVKFFQMWDFSVAELGLGLMIKISKNLPNVTFLEVKTMTVSLPLQNPTRTPKKMPMKLFQM
jgi:hypothetical protein